MTQCLSQDVPERSDLLFQAKAMVGNGSLDFLADQQARSRSGRGDAGNLGLTVITRERQTHTCTLPSDSTR